MSGMMQTISNFFTNKKVIIILVVAVIFIALAFYVYSYYIAPTLQPTFVPNKEFEKEKPKFAEITLFYVSWCPHSTKAKKSWEKVKETYNEKVINGTVVTFKEIDGEENDGATINAFEDSTGKKIEGYPTILMIKGDQVIEFDAKPEEKSLTDFLHTTL